MWQPVVNSRRLLLALSSAPSLPRRIPPVRLPPCTPGYTGGEAEGRSNRDVERSDDPTRQRTAEQTSGEHHHDHQSPCAEREKSAEAAAVATLDNPDDHSPGGPVEHQLGFGRTDRDRSGSDPRRSHRRRAPHPPPSKPDQRRPHRRPQKPCQYQLRLHRSCRFVTICPIRHAKPPRNGGENPTNVPRHIPRTPFSPGVDPRTTRTQTVSDRRQRMPRVPNFITRGNHHGEIMSSRHPGHRPRGRRRARQRSGAPAADGPPVRAPW